MKLACVKNKSVKILELELRINVLMARFVIQVKGSSAMGRTDINLASENVLIPLFSQLYDLKHLKNLNTEEAANYPGVDLGDEEARVAFQITAESNSNKIKETLGMFVQHELYKKYDRLFVYILTEKQKSYSGNGFAAITSGTHFTFNKDKDIIDYTDVLSMVGKLSVDEAVVIESLLEKNFGNDKATFLVRNGPEISTSRLPTLFGREVELVLLDQAWANPGTHLVCVVAWGGVGKSALVNRWLGSMTEEQFRGATRVFGWSFYSQGTAADRVASADEFIDAALRWFGDPDPTQGSAWNKGERLARLVKGQRTLLVLDGLEPLQAPPGDKEGQLKDQALQALLRELAAQNPGLCLVTTRYPVAGLEPSLGACIQQIDLEHLAPAAGAELLRSLGVQGGTQELEQAAQEFGGHSLALLLLGSYLADACEGDVRRRDTVGPLVEEERYGGHARRVMASYETWLGEGPELALLRVLGFFDRPAEQAALDAVTRSNPLIPHLGEREWRRTVAKLRRARLVAEADPARPDALDTHPLVRQHFGEQLRRAHPEAWRKGNSQLFDHYARTAKAEPDTLQEMVPLFAAVRHGCAAGRYDEALHNVYERRITRGAFYATAYLGAYGACLSALSDFFSEPWFQTVPQLSSLWRGYAFDQVSLHLTALGRLAEAVDPMKASLDWAWAIRNKHNVIWACHNLSALYLDIGQIDLALAFATDGAEVAKNFGEVEPFTVMITPVVIGHVLHQAGRFAEAEARFQQAEALQCLMWPADLFLVGARGFQYCDLLLDQGRYAAVQQRAEHALRWGATWGTIPMEAGLNHLALGRALLLQMRQTDSGDFTQVSAHMTQGLNHLREASRQEPFVRGLLAHAELQQATNDLDRAQTDLDEALALATRGSMGLHQADCHLAYCRLHLARDDEDKARQSLTTAQAMIDRLGYRRRSEETAALRAELQVRSVPKVKRSEIAQ